jgi:hypothetical protein
VDFEGSDNSAVSSNAAYYASAQEILANAHLPFGSEMEVQHNDLPQVQNGGTAQIVLNYQSAYVFDNHIEQADSEATNAGISLINNGASLYMIHDNQMGITKVGTPCWLTVSGSPYLLSLRNNVTNAGPAPSPACFNNGDGERYWFAGGVRNTIDAWGNSD